MGDNGRKKEGRKEGREIKIGGWVRITRVTKVRVNLMRRQVHLQKWNITK